MTRRKSPMPRGPALPAAAITALLLAGCSSGHVGESWQCPLAEGGTCDSVAAADPAVPDLDSARKAVLAEPLWRARGSNEVAPAREPARDAIRGPGQACEADCGGGFDPLGWLVRLLGADPGSEAGASEEDGPPAQAKSPSAAAAAPPPAARPGPVEPAAAALPGEPAPDEHASDSEGLRGDDLRTGEVVARIWIAPFVDAEGVYREASHVRVVLEPAGWRLPR